MPIQPPPLLQSLFNDLTARAAQTLQPPAWLLHEGRQRIVLLLNHILMQQPEAMQRLTRQQGRTVRVQWSSQRLHDQQTTAALSSLAAMSPSITLQITPAGLFNLAAEGVQPDLHLQITDTNPLTLAQTALRGERPSIHIAGDVRLATELQWLIDHVRWDVEQDLARLLGEKPARTLAVTARTAADALRQFVTTWVGRAEEPRPNSHHSNSTAPATTTPGSGSGGR